MKNFIAASLASLSLFSCLPAAAYPSLGFSVVETPYGTFGCRTRAENKLFSIGATGVKRSSESATIWGVFNEFSIGIWCRGNEALILIGGDKSTTELRDELRSAF